MVPSPCLSADKPRFTILLANHLGNGPCKEAMFMSSDTEKIRKAAHLACLAQYAFQRNWFPDPIAGLFSYQTWNGMDGFWQNGIAIETMANTMHYGNHTRYFSVLKVSSRASAFKSFSL